VSYLQLDDGILDHPKFIRADREAPSGAVHLWLGLMAYCKRHLTDGVVPLDMLPKVQGPPPRWRKRALDALIGAGLIERTGTELRVHDYLEWNLSKAEIERKSADRKAAADRRRKDLESRAQQPGERMYNRGVSVDPIAGRPSLLPQGDVQGDRLSVANDTEHLSPLDPRHVSPRARETETETETETEIRSPDHPQPPPAEAVERPAKFASTSSARVGTIRPPTRGKTQCPPDFKPDRTTLGTATSLGFSTALELETRADFIDWWRSAQRPKGDWQATYRNWLRKSARQLGLKPPKPDTPQSTLWREQRDRALAPVTNPAPRAREQLDAAAGKLFAG